MATFPAGQQTDHAVPPHPARLPPPPSPDTLRAQYFLRALESESADTLRIRDGTGLGHRDAVPGVEPVRGGTTSTSPGTGGLTPDPGRVEEQDREVHTIRTVHPSVCLLDRGGQPLRPCPAARARKLPAKGRAVLHRHTPFTIRIKDRTLAESEVGGVEIGIDPGSEHTGIAVFTAQAGDRHGGYSIQVDHRGGAIRRKLAQRSGYRRRRRSANLRYRTPLFLNRTRPRGWLAPSSRHRVETTPSWVDRLSRWAPLRRPRNKQSFDFSPEDPVRAVVPSIRRRGARTGRVLVRAKGAVDITTHAGRQAGISHRHVRLLRRADGYSYSIRPEAFPVLSRTLASQTGDAPPPGSEGPGLHTRSSR